MEEEGREVHVMVPETPKTGNSDVILHSEIQGLRSRVDELTDEVGRLKAEVPAHAHEDYAPRAHGHTEYATREELHSSVEAADQRAEEAEEAAADAVDEVDVSEGAHEAESEVEEEPRYMRKGLRRRRVGT